MLWNQENMSCIFLLYMSCITIPLVHIYTVFLQCLSWTLQQRLLICIPYKITWNSNMSNGRKLAGTKEGVLFIFFSLSCAPKMDFWMYLWHFCPQIKTLPKVLYSLLKQNLLTQREKTPRLATINNSYSKSLVNAYNTEAICAWDFHFHMGSTEVPIYITLCSDINIKHCWLFLP